MVGLMIKLYITDEGFKTNLGVCEIIDAGTEITLPKNTKKLRMFYVEKDGENKIVMSIIKKGDKKK